MAEITAEILRNIGMEDFTEEEERVWKDWVDFIYGDHPSDLKKIILEEDYKTKFKQRAIVVMLVPDFNNLPFYWYSGYPWSKPNFCSAFPSLKEINANLIQFISELIIECLKVLDYNSEIISAEKEKNVDLWCDYQNYLLDLLEIISDDAQKEILFSYFSLNDALPYENMDSSSGYNPFWNLMKRKQIDEKWKKRADQKMQSIAMSEMKLEKEISSKGNYYTSALICYAGIVEDYIRSSELHYSKELLESQIKFIIDNVNMVNPDEYPNLIANESVSKIMEIFYEEKYITLRYELCNYMILKNYSNLKIHCEEELVAAKKIYKQCSDLREDLKNKLVRIINEGENYVLAEEESKRKNQKIRDEIISKMKN